MEKKELDILRALRFRGYSLRINGIDCYLQTTQGDIRELHFELEEGLTIADLIVDKLKQSDEPSHKTILKHLLEIELT